ncbi:hypothetical protein BKA81DRAFT_41637 [Phyllosticta paracitricarpa]|uniref:Secreted protein n=2 Tax=Phyllosticta TaxID=121621 RepID=A0ABR1MMG3_9PEZI
MVQYTPLLPLCWSVLWSTSRIAALSTCAPATCLPLAFCTHARTHSPTFAPHHHNHPPLCQSIIHRLIPPHTHHGSPIPSPASLPLLASFAWPRFSFCTPTPFHPSISPSALICMLCLSCACKDSQHLCVASLIDI